MKLSIHLHYYYQHFLIINLLGIQANSLLICQLKLYSIQSTQIIQLLDRKSKLKQVLLLYIREINLFGLTITGGASGLGLATVELLISKQCKVVAADFNEEKGEELIKKFEYGNLRFLKTDVQNEDEIRKLIEFTAKEFGQINLVVNSAGIPSAQMTATRSSVASTSEMNILLQINVVGTFNVCKYAAQHMINSQVKGVIINVASLAGIEGQRGQVIYSASKGAVIAMTLPMARDLGKHGIRVVTIAPGIIYTPMFEMIQPKIKAQLEQQVALGRLGAAKEFAQLVQMIYQSDYLTGCVLRLDGGLRVPHL